MRGSIGVRKMENMIIAAVGDFRKEFHAAIEEDVLGDIVKIKACARRR